MLELGRNLANLARIGKKENGAPKSHTKGAPKGAPYASDSSEQCQV